MDATSRRMLACGVGVCVVSAALLTLGQTAPPSRSHDELRGVVRAARAQIEQCYRTAPPAEKREAQRLTAVTVRVEPTGALELVSTVPTILAPQITACVTQLARQVTLPAHLGEVAATLTLSRGELSRFMR